MLLLAAGSVWNIRHLDDLTARLEAEVQRSRACWSVGDTAGAAEALEGALREWERQDSYTNIFIRHTEVDALSRTFYDVLSALDRQDGGLGREYDRLAAQLREIDAMDHPTLKSIF